MSCVCKLIHSPHLSRLKEGSCSARPAITMPQSRALSAVQSQLVPHIINECFSIKASLIHWLHTHKKRLLHFHFNRYTPISYIRMILQAQNSLWHSTCHGRMLSDFSMYLVCYWPVSCFHGNVWLLLKCPLKTLLANTLKFVRFGMNSTSTSVFHQFLFFCLFVFLHPVHLPIISNENVSFHFHNMAPSSCYISLHQCRVRTDSIGTSTIYIY